MSEGAYSLDDFRVLIGGNFAPFFSSVRNDCSLGTERQCVGTPIILLNNLSYQGFVEM